MPANEVFNCAYSEILKISKVKPHPKNPNVHPPAQVAQLAEVIRYQGQRLPIIISKRSGYLVAGHGRLMAIKILGWELIAVDYQDFESDEQEYAFLIADNAIASQAELNFKLINEILPDLDHTKLPPPSDFGVFGVFGLVDFTIDPKISLPSSGKDGITEGTTPHLNGENPNATVQSIVMTFENEEYVTIMQRCVDAMEKTKTKSIKELFAFLVNGFKV